MSFRVRYKGNCEDCGGDIEVGELASYVGDGIVHPLCPDDVSATKYGVCPQCFLALPATGKCECRE